MERKKKFYVCIFGQNPNAEQINNKIEGEIEVFDTTKDLNNWLTINQVVPHKNEALAGRCLLQMPGDDKRAVLIIDGNPKAIQTKIQVA